MNSEYRNVKDLNDLVDSAKKGLLEYNDGYEFISLTYDSYITISNFHNLERFRIKDEYKKYSNKIEKLNLDNISSNSQQKTVIVNKINEIIDRISEF
jgi:hypothetical protein